MSESMKKYLHTIVMIVLLFSGFFVPATGLVTGYGMKVIGIFLGMMWGWLFLDLTYPSILGLCVLSLAGYGVAKATFMAGIGCEVVLVVILSQNFTRKTLCFYYSILGINIYFGNFGRYLSNNFHAMAGNL